MVSVYSINQDNQRQQVIKVKLSLSVSHEHSLVSSNRLLA